MIKGFRLQLFKQTDVVIYHKSKNYAGLGKSKDVIIRIISFRVLMPVLLIFVYITHGCHRNPKPYDAP
jgi:hypothetical protein